MDYILTSYRFNLMDNYIFPILTICGGILLTYINYAIWRITLQIRDVNIEIVEFTKEIRNLTEATLDVTIDVRHLSKDLLEITKQLKEKI